MKKLLLALPLGVALLAPAYSFAQDHDRDDHHDRDHRYYDAEHRDYHEWNANEDRAYHRYWEDRRHRYIDWERANAAQRRAYWHWRHEHPDSVLFQVNVR
jgi:hypothetical protein